MQAATEAAYSPRALAKPSPERLVEQHLGLVRKIAWHVYGRMSSAIEIDDLVQIGMIALLEAARTFEERGTAAFTTYATMRVRGAMIDHLRRQASLCRGGLRRRKQLVEARAALEREHGRKPSDDEVAARLELTPAAYRAFVDSAESLRYESIDAVYSDHSEWFASDDESAHDSLERERMQEALAEHIGGLPEREALVLQLYFVEELNLEEIGAVLDVGAARVCQIKKAALTRLRERLADWGD